MDGETMVWMRRGRKTGRVRFFGAVGLYVETGNTITSIASNPTFLS